MKDVISSINVLIIKYLVFERSGNDNCSVDKLNIHMMNKLNLKSL